MIVIAGKSNATLSTKIAENLNSTLFPVNIANFKNGEIKIEIQKTIRNEHVFIVQTGYCNLYMNYSVNDILIETLLMIDAIRRSNPKSISLVIPLFFYSRQDRKDLSREPISASFICRMFETSGVDRILTIDLHSPQTQGFFYKAFDNLYCVNVLHSKLNEYFNNDLTRMVLISPDVGAVARTSKISKIMNIPFTVIYKHRDSAGKVIKNEILSSNHEYGNKKAIIVDDMIDSGGTFLKACELLIQNGFAEVYGCITHGLFTSDAIKNINDSTYIKKIFVSNSVDQTSNIAKSTKIVEFDVSYLLSSAITKIHEGLPLGTLFEY
tara:strand:+ start:4754 stop:5725 length:972 start_codon:yes stop_codon:yes gene_type:complete